MSDDLQAEGFAPEAARLFGHLADEFGDLEVLDAVRTFVGGHAHAAAVAMSAEQPRDIQNALTSHRAIPAFGHPAIHHAFSHLVEQLGRVRAVEASLAVLARYARPGAIRALGRRKGKPETVCPDCRGRDALAKATIENLKRYSADARKSRQVDGAASLPHTTPAEG
jgi:hypothetical protein